MRAVVLFGTLLVGGCLRLGFGTGAPDGDGPGPADSAILPEILPEILPAPDRGAPDLISTPWPGFDLHLFKAYWSSAGTIGWVWQCSGTLPSFDRYELCMDTDPAQVLAGGGTCLDPQDSYALGNFECLGPPWGPMVVTYGLKPDTTYHARLHLRDKSGAHLGSPLATISTTTLPAAKTVVFTEGLLPGAWLTDLAQSSVKPHSGSVGLVANILDEQWYNLHYGGMKLAFPGLTDSRLTDGYLELYLDTPRPTKICVTLQQSNDTAEHCPPDYFVAPDGKTGYQRIQIPLSQFISQKTKQPMTAAQLAATNKLMPGAIWGKGTVYIDDVVFRY